jgi:predicted nucleic acid-binding protein
MAPDGVVVDASVLIAAAVPGEPGHAVARAFLERCSESKLSLLAPAIVIPEIMGAIARSSGRPRLATRLAATYRSREEFAVLPVKVTLAESAGQIGALQGTRGCDAVYLALARARGFPLITLDREQRERAPADLQVQTPEQALTAWSMGRAP